VKRLVKERFPAHFNFDVLSGVRGIYIDLKKEIPAFLYLRGCHVKIHYYGMKEKCHICGYSEHMRSKCPSQLNFESKRNSKFEKNLVEKGCNQQFFR
jgi:hypothetical protein